MQKLRRFHFSSDVQYLLHTVIDSYPEDGSGKGIPMGNQSSQCFALLYLDKVDRLIKEQLGISFYVRYMDDMILLVRDRRTAQHCLAAVGADVKKEKLSLNPKSAIIDVRNGVEFLGWHFSYTSTGKIIQKVKSKSKKRILKKVKSIPYTVKTGRSSKESLRASAAGYKGYLQQGNACGLYKKICRMLCISLS